MRGIDRVSQCFVAFALTAGLALGGCGAQNPATRNETGKESAADASASKQPRKDEKITYIASNEKYGLQLPNGDAFGEIFKDFIYWDYATQIEKNEDKLELEGDILGCDILGHLKAMKLLDREVKIRLYYRECDKEEHYRESNFYHVIVGFPESKDTDNSWLSMEYSSRGLSSEYDWECCEWLDIDKQISFEKLEQNKEIMKQYTSMGETSIAVSEAEAKAYQPENKFPEGEKEQILTAIENAVKHEYKEAKDTMLFIHDFLPGNSNFSGKAVDLNVTDKYDMPVYGIRSQINYSGDKLEQLDGIYWSTYVSLPEYSTAYPTLKLLKGLAKREAEEMDAKKCILAFHIKDGKVIGMNDHSPSLTEKEEVLGSNDYSSVLTEKKVRENFGVPDEADITIKYGKFTSYKQGFGARIVAVDVYEDGKRKAGGYCLIQNGEPGCNLTSDYEEPEKK